jgi:hypothetical protein
MPEDAHRAEGGEPGYGADLAAREVSMRSRWRGRPGLRLAHVEAECGLAVGPGRHQPGGAPGRKAVAARNRAASSRP